MVRHELFLTTGSIYSQDSLDTTKPNFLDKPWLLAHHSRIKQSDVYGFLSGQQAFVKACAESAPRLRVMYEGFLAL
jgi:hypothetical protein